uniref:Transcription factor CBF/NF-Y/archaeal histone domain-containing protein n=1 Tax=Romanomermis culicivorax TaxID=13658 RepID=A0A915JQ59_ROMCU
MINSCYTYVPRGAARLRIQPKPNRKSTQNLPSDEKTKLTGRKNHLFNIDGDTSVWTEKKDTFLNLLLLAAENLERARIKRIIQKDEEIGKVANAVPVMIGRTLELFISQLIDKMTDIAQAHQAKTLSPQLLKAAIKSEPLFTFLEPVVAVIPDLESVDSTQPTSSNSRRRSSALSDTNTKEKPPKKARRVSRNQANFLLSADEESEQQEDDEHREESKQNSSVIFIDCE